MILFFKLANFTIIIGNLIFGKILFSLPSIVLILIFLNKKWQQPTNIYIYIYIYIYMYICIYTY